MKVLYLDLNYDDLVEDYSPMSKYYGGGAIVARHLMPWMNKNGHSMDIASNPKSFDGVKEKSHCIHLDAGQRAELRMGAPVKTILTNAGDYDIIFHNFYTTKLNLDGIKAKDAVWLVGFGEHVNPRNTRVILYNDYQNPKIVNPATFIYKARIGIPVPEFVERKKEDFIFSCHRQSVMFGARWMMKMAHKFKFRYITAGPPDKDFPEMMQYVDNQYVTYLGIISQEKKTELYSKAYASTSLHYWSTPMNLSALESLALGTPIIAHYIGFWPSLIKNGTNGFFIDKEDDLGLLGSIGASASIIKQQNCYDSMLHLSADNMIKDYVNVFEKIMTE